MARTLWGLGASRRPRRKPPAPGAPHKERHMFYRLPAAPTLVLLLSLSLAACVGAEGQTGPTGVAGPGSRIVLSGTINIPDIADTTFCDNWPSTSTESRHGQRSSGHYVLDITEWCDLVE
jgi:hypothetical protein